MSDNEPVLPNKFSSLTVDEVLAHEVARGLMEVPDFGVGHLSVSEAAELITIDRWFSGEITNVPGIAIDDIQSSQDPRLIPALATEIAAFRELLVAAIQKGTLKPSRLRRTLSDDLDIEMTFCKYESVHEWLCDRGYTPGETMDEWLEIQAEILGGLCPEVVALQSIGKQGVSAIRNHNFKNTYLRKVGTGDEVDISWFRTELTALRVQNEYLKGQLESKQTVNHSKVDRPITTRARRTLLTVIAALCRASKIDWKQRGASQRVKELTEILGCPVDDQTIAKALSEIQDALDTRML